MNCSNYSTKYLSELLIKIADDFPINLVVKGGEMTHRWALKGKIKHGSCLGASIRP